MKTLVMLLLAAVAPIYAQTTVTGPIAHPMGGNFSGRLILTAPTQMTYNGQTYVGWQRDITITNGAFNISLIPNIGSTPEGTSYRAQYLPNSGPGWTEFWVVPESATPIQVYQVRVEVPPTPTMTVRLDQLEGGTVPGQCLKWDGTTWAPATDCGGGGSGTPGQIEFSFSGLSHLVIPNGFGSENVIVICSDTNNMIHNGILQVSPTAPYGITVDYDFAISGVCKISSGPAYGKDFTSATEVSIQPEEHKLVGVKSSFCRDAAGVRLHPAVSFDHYAAGGVEFTGVRNYFDFSNTGRCAVIGAN